MTQQGGSPATIPLPAPLALEEGQGLVTEKTWKKWRKMWDAYAVVSKLKNEDKETQVATLTLAIGSEAVDIVDTLPYAQESDRKDLKKF